MSPSVAALMDEFDFLPRWRLDDVMISYAPPGGNVGAHIDQYDVFYSKPAVTAAGNWEAD
ncbi:hypothetical protein HSBAA_17470 [Vreelandella sulfidaeris]|uniref:JmjC domain-containing protein n=1 Tax=Vreelandella sulfidaeris TaxID=115553 RepID=A0A455U7I0_9GAMM|nr:hypothetical protein HSBAA_17470 [Halomonas sulfidaeris]